MHSRRNRQRRISLVALLALVSSLLASPFAHAHAMRMAAVGTDLCTAASGMSSKPAAPAEQRRVTHGAECSCCTGSAPNLVQALAPVVAPWRQDVALENAAAEPTLRHDIQSPRGGQPRAPPILA